MITSRRNKFGILQRYVWVMFQYLLPGHEYYSVICLDLKESIGVAKFISMNLKEKQRNEGQTLNFTEVFFILLSGFHSCALTDSLVISNNVIPK